ncbi:two-component system sensor histidine kinase BasS [Candidatus Symbiopectobacterium sp. 'North America']|nr:two-component system sensor histidine kinase BasS [Candidatus Symbiopectobacterium sp. 'North America']
MSPPAASMRWRLIIALGCILLTCQLISVAWLWHESKEQIEFLVDKTMSEHARNDHIAKKIRESIASLSIPSLVMVLASLFLSIQAVNWITRPLSRLAAELGNRSAENLEPIADYQQVEEIAAVTRSMNQLFVRLNETLERERQFTADVAHKLRTPLAGIRLHLELQQQRHGVDCQPLISRIDTMTRTVEQLLQLASAAVAFSSGHYQQISLAQDVIVPIQDAVEEMASQRNQRIDWQISEEEVAIQGDATLLQLLLRNLIENAHRYSPPESTITLRLTADPEITLQVRDQGPGIDESKVGELSKAFVRMNTRYGGIGLGLSIVTRVAQLHHGALTISNLREGNGTLAEVTFPPLLSWRDAIP